MRPCSRLACLVVSSPSFSPEGGVICAVVVGFCSFEASPSRQRVCPRADGDLEGGAGGVSCVRFGAIDVVRRKDLREGRRKSATELLTLAAGAVDVAQSKAGLAGFT
jgi:hypothetical protein